MTEQVEQWACIKSCLKLEHSSVETIWIIQKAAVMGNWWLAALTQCIHSCITSHAEFFGETSNHPGDSAPYSPYLVLCDFWLLLKLKSPLKGKRFQTINETEEIKEGSWWWLGKLCEVPRCLLWRGQRHRCLMYNISCIFFNKCLHFSYYMAGYLLDRPCIFPHYHC